MGFFSFIIALAILLIFLGIGATQGFSFEVFFGLLKAGVKFVVALVKALFNA